ncbi:CHASE2 domain-containing protein [Psychrosphaera sp. G1-22]|uniref:CHASE2 domain-containing protein n=1 Tax=Psychrosphaera algicola TaxID=3023714 RepID=A0ABT5FHV0_9GAMM|nr:CHASE2 domain-containing protein [Psychrosphaera sp. G1-22]MDC2890761.1 CHASE2 domain-containing protein [Psychrosphaera sp. G1-22]
MVLAVAPSGSTLFSTAEYELLPTPLLAKNAAILGHVHFELDSDGTIRKVFLNAGYKETKWPSFGLALASLHDETVNAIDSDVVLGNGWVRKNPRLLSYQQVKGGIDSYSYVDVLNGTVDLTKLNDKVILIGMTASAMGDRFITPTSPSHGTTLMGIY